MSSCQTCLNVQTRASKLRQPGKLRCMDSGVQRRNRINISCPVISKFLFVIPYNFPTNQYRHKVADMEQISWVCRNTICKLTVILCSSYFLLKCSQFPSLVTRVSLCKVNCYQLDTLHWLQCCVDKDGVKTIFQANLFILGLHWLVDREVEAEAEVIASE